MNKTLSDDANNALRWLMGEQSRRMKCGEARAAILEGFGAKVDEELQAFFRSPNAEVSDTTKYYDTGTPR